MRRTFMMGILVLLVAWLSTGWCLQVKLTRVSTVFLPTYTDAGATYQLDSDTLEQLAFDARYKIIYGVGEGVIHVIDARDVTNLRMLFHVRLRELDLTDVEVCGEGVFMSYKNMSQPLTGGVLVYQIYSPGSQGLNLLHDIPMGSLPDMVYPTKDCTLVVALENSGVVVDGVFHDPPGGVGIVRFPQGISGPPSFRSLDFTKFDSQFDQLSKSGVRWVYRGSGNNFSNDIEPEYVAFNSDYTKAYVVLQENNAMAVVDIANNNITDIYGLGFKRWGDLDPSDRDGGIHIRPWPVYGMYQPDSIAWTHWNGEDYVITANEGDSIDYDRPVDFNEVVRGNKIQNSEIASTVSDELKEALRDNTKLGRIQFSNVQGKNAEGKFENFYSFGARSFSIWRASDMAQVFDSGSDLENITAQLRPDLYNNDIEGDATVISRMDRRSDNKGVEPESLAVGELGGHLLVFVGLERPGTVAVYSVSPAVRLDVTFQTLYSGGIPENSEDVLSQQLYDDRRLFGIDPEYLQFFSSSDGFADFPALLMAGSVSGTVTVLRVDVVEPTASCSVCSGVDCYLGPTVTQCPVGESLCITNVTNSYDGGQISRGCASLAMCDELYLSHTAEKTECANADDQALPEGRRCHFCCFGDNCNGPLGLIPHPDTLYKTPLVG